MTSLRLWILVMAATCFLAGAATARLVETRPDVQQPPSLACLDEYLASASYPSPPGSRYSSPVHGQSSSSSSYPTHPPPSYEQHMTYHHHNHQQQTHTETPYLAPAAAEDQSMSYMLPSDLPLFAISTKQEPDFTEAASPALVQGKKST